ncbi:polysaccharide biosynthesis protein [Cellvibrio sp. KY-GH-1]|uniref:polysaccharide biosynthesis protein n=1 Tax=Cellvibrio sp. KY-GH-1 TaxID=2303332 RepID=UPI00124756A2|nr:nucleoside-diphosphate sugar epimerase/dehydratase [Cellvibrio sp. KY-GH-1]QEY15076.1 polysaccharide biosynthesis protein [Cellvibrio sp. KY-GH-1]
MLIKLLEASRATKRVISLCYDSFAIVLGVYFSNCIRFGTFDLLITSKELTALLITLLTTLVIFIKSGMYRAILRYMTQPAIVTIIICVLLSGVTLAVSGFLTYSKIPRSVPFIYIGLMLILIGGPRLLVRHVILKMGALPPGDMVPVIIYGAGRTGHQLMLALRDTGYRVVAFVDDNSSLHGTLLANIKIHSPAELPRLITATSAVKVLLALGRTPHSLRLEIIKQLEKLQINVQTIPDMGDILSGRAHIENVRDVDVEDLLGRDSVQPLSDLMAESITDKVVMVTGAGGSIGSELCRQIIECKPKALILLDHNEYSLYVLEQELAARNLPLVSIVPLLGSVQNSAFLKSVFKNHRVNSIYHAAAYKHVPLVESNIVEGIKNNVIGTLCCAEAAVAAGVGLFVLISTDKAVRPTNIMGASKRLAELILQSVAQRQELTRFVMVRFGNVLGSSGSVVPLFRKQIKDGGPVTVTHPEIIRYFMTIKEASQLVIQAGAMGKGGDVFVLDMGEPVKIVDLALRMIHLSGLSVRDAANPEGDIEIRYSGLRPGEKLYEELLIGDNVFATDHPRIFKALERSVSWGEMEIFLNKLNIACEMDEPNKIKHMLREMPLEYNWALTEEQDPPRAALSRVS